jgi:tRNA-specific 2-thiouridylase
VAALLLKEQGYDLCGATLKLFDNQDIGLQTKTCCSLNDVADARSVAYRLGFEHFVFNFGEQFQKEVIDRFAKGYAAGETPNPCIDCNRFIKFSKMLQRARLLEYDQIATGHYARVAYDANTGRYLLKKAIDLTKDQSYVLYGLTQEELAGTLFPLGELTKETVRGLASQNGLVNADKPDSQDICFVKDGDYPNFLENVLGVVNNKGDFVDKDRKVLGKHKGFINYTIGQRKGLGMSFNQPKYVVGKDKEQGAIVLGDYDDLLSAGLVARDVNLISISVLDVPLEVTAKTRYKQKER